MNAKNYMKIVEWSNEDKCYVGSAPPLIGQCCHGDTEEEVYKQLAGIVEEWIEIYKKDGRPLPEPSTNKEYNGKILARVRPEIHRALAIRALQERRSLNSVIEAALERECLASPAPKAVRRKKAAA